MQVFEARLILIVAEDPAAGKRELHMILFTILNGFVNHKRYDSKDRALIKLFLENCQHIFQKVLRIK